MCDIKSFLFINEVSPESSKIGTFELFDQLVIGKESLIGLFYLMKIVVQARGTYSYHL